MIIFRLCFHCFLFFPLIYPFSWPFLVHTYTKHTYDTSTYTGVFVLASSVHTTTENSTRQLLRASMSSGMPHHHIANTAQPQCNQPCTKQQSMFRCRPGRDNVSKQSCQKPTCREQSGFYPRSSQRCPVRQVSCSSTGTPTYQASLRTRAAGHRAPRRS